MKYKYSSLILIIISITCIGNIPVHAASAMNEKSATVVIESADIPSFVKPGTKPISLNDRLLGRLLPELRNPRLMILADLDKSDQKTFIEEGFAFVLRGDFNRDKVADIAFVGKYDNPQDPKLNTFIAIISIKGKKIIRTYMQTVQRERIALSFLPEYKKGIDAIQMIYVFGSDDCAFLFWSKKEWRWELCSESVEQSMKDLPKTIEQSMKNLPNY